VILLDIYPARELPIPGVTSEIIFKDITSDKVLLQRSELMDYLRNEPVEVLATLGAGDIDRFVGEIADMLDKR
jgi:UDP-N-acetylmuramate--alanine ligase